MWFIFQISEIADEQDRDPNLLSYRDHHHSSLLRLLLDTRWSSSSAKIVTSSGVRSCWLSSRSFRHRFGHGDEFHPGSPFRSWIVVSRNRRWFHSSHEVVCLWSACVKVSLIKFEKKIKEELKKSSVWAGAPWQWYSWPWIIKNIEEKNVKWRIRKVRRQQSVVGFRKVPRVCAKRLKSQSSCEC